MIMFIAVFVIVLVFSVVVLFFEKEIVFYARVIGHFSYGNKAWEVVKLRYGFNIIEKEAAARKLLTFKKLSPKILAHLQKFSFQTRDLEIQVLFRERWKLHYNLGLTDLLIQEEDTSIVRAKAA